MGRERFIPAMNDGAFSPSSCKAVVAGAPVEAEKAERFPSRIRWKKRLERTVYPQHHILQYLAVDVAVFGHGRFDVGQSALLLMICDSDTTQAPGFAPFAHGGIVDMTTKRHGVLKQPLLFGCGLEFTFECLANALLFHIRLFYSLGGNPVIASTFVAFASRLYGAMDDPASIPIDKSRSFGWEIASAE
jgi:hypothetical protein